MTPSVLNPQRRCFRPHFKLMGNRTHRPSHLPRPHGEWQHQGWLRATRLECACTGHGGREGPPCPAGAWRGGGPRAMLRGLPGTRGRSEAAQETRGAEVSSAAGGETAAWRPGEDTGGDPPPRQPQAQARTCVTEAGARGPRPGGGREWCRAGRQSTLSTHLTQCDLWVWAPGCRVSQADPDLSWGPLCPREAGAELRVHFPRVGGDGTTPQLPLVPSENA